MKRILAITAALLLMVSLLGSVVLADRGGNGGGQGSHPQTQGPSRGPADDDTDDQESKWEAKEEAKQAREEAKEAREEADDNDETARGRSSDEGDSDRDGHRVRGRIRDEAPDDIEGDDDDQGIEDVDELDEVDDDQDADDDQDVDDDEDDEDADDLDGNEIDDDGGDEDVPQNMAKRLEKWQRKVQQSARHALKTNNGVKPFMLVGQPEIDSEGNLSVTVWKGNQIVRDYQYSEDVSTVTITPTAVIRIVGPSGVVECEGTLEECLPDPLPEDAYVSVWGRVETIGDGADAEEVFVARRITITMPTMPAPIATLPTPTATLPTPTATLPTPTATLPTPTATLPTPTATPTK